MTFQPKSSTRIISHPSGQSTYIYDDDFTDPWLPHETILIQHGFGRHGAFWYHWVPVLSRQYRVIRRDLRGHGGSSYPETGDAKYDYSLETILGEIIDTLDQLGLEKVHFVGESTSGMLAEILAARHSARLLSLSICSSPTHLPPAALEMFAMGHETWPTAVRELGSRGWATALSSIPGTLSIPDPRYVKWWIEQVSLSASQGLAGYATFLSSLDSRPYLKDIKVPMLVLAPARSVAARLEEQHAIEKEVNSSGGNCRLVVIDGQGHEIYVEMAEECQRAFLQFLAGLKRG